MNEVTGTQDEFDAEIAELGKRIKAAKLKDPAGFERQIAPLRADLDAHAEEIRQREEKNRIRDLAARRNELASNVVQLLKQAHVALDGLIELDASLIAELPRQATIRLGRSVLEGAFHGELVRQGLASSGTPGDFLLAVEEGSKLVESGL